eukprot:CAMPEP_0203815432 /NCGR_PEP_ID=MMETSP0115-20131106/11117_1 /ASSEMBLY_ACC=CAM_ASM_000227 /TAXON_ID=33651 /ORGANISM="Bicosoecid sp, Strain ms1" /LENGTH=142 /DNA_ID=CAMNT_0050724329 /DNA_START=60 /DNA_END=489 /DNA_ORIENTATION=+
MADEGALKTSWPELVGAEGEDAVKTILSERPDLKPANVATLPQDAMVTMDYRVDRVRVFVNTDGTVAARRGSGERGCGQRRGLAKGEMAQQQLVAASHSCCCCCHVSALPGLHESLTNETPEWSARAWGYAIMRPRPRCCAV